MTKKKLYAIGFKQHVELRLSSKPIIEEITEAFIPSDYSKSKFKLRIVHHAGGKVIKTMPSSKFAGLTGMYVAEGQLVEVPAKFAKRFL